MKQINPEAIKDTNREASSSENLVTQARAEVAKVTMEANHEESVQQELQIELMNAQKEAERRKEAQEKNKDTKERIAEVAGSRG